MRRYAFILNFKEGLVPHFLRRGREQMLRIMWMASVLEMYLMNEGEGQGSAQTLAHFSSAAHANRQKEKESPASFRC